MYHINPDVHFTTINKDTIVYNSVTGKYYNLNYTAGFILKQLSLRIAPIDIARMVTESFSEATLEISTQAVEHCIQDFIRQEIILINETDE